MLYLKHQSINYKHLSPALKYCLIFTEDIVNNTNLTRLQLVYFSTRKRELACLNFNRVIGFGSAILSALRISNVSQISCEGIKCNGFTDV